MVVFAWTGIKCFLWGVFLYTFNTVQEHQAVFITKVANYVQVIHNGNQFDWASTNRETVKKG